MSYSSQILRNGGTGLLGGGLICLSPQYGFAADMLREVDLVLVSGDLVTASATNEHADLFWALKGGNKFGLFLPL